MKTRRTFTKEFKVDLLRELESGKTTVQVCREHGLHPSLVGRWYREYLKNPEDAFSGNETLIRPMQNSLNMNA